MPADQGMTTQAGAGKATTIRTAFRVSFSVTTSIDAPAATIWKLLTDLSAQSKWNSTLTSIDGEVALGKRVTFEVPEARGQKFSPTVVAYEEPRSMVWRLNRWPLLVSERTYRLTPAPDGSTEFTITEVFWGLLLPVVAKTLPDFGLMFERTASDLKTAAATAHH
jgi:hypothetical protein